MPIPEAPDGLAVIGFNAWLGTRRQHYFDLARSGSPVRDGSSWTRTGFDIITTVSRLLAHGMGCQTPWDALDEITRVTPTHAAASRERLGRRGLQWPVHADGTDSPTL